MSQAALRGHHSKAARRAVSFEPTEHAAAHRRRASLRTLTATLVAASFGVACGGAAPHTEAAATEPRKPRAEPAASSAASPEEPVATAPPESAPAANEPPPAPATSNAMSHVAGGSIENANRVVAGYRRKFNDCYAEELARNRKASGRLEVKFTVTLAGQIENLRITPQGELSPAFQGCVGGVIEQSQFDKPEGKAAEVALWPSFQNGSDAQVLHTDDLPF